MLESLIHKLPYTRVSRPGPSAPLGATELFSGGYEQTLLMSSGPQLCWESLEGDYKPWKVENHCPIPCWRYRWSFYWAHHLCRPQCVFLPQQSLKCVFNAWQTSTWINGNCYCAQVQKLEYNWCLYCCDRKSRAAYAQSFALWQQATIEFTCHDHSPRTLVVTFNDSQVNIGRSSTPRSLFHCLFAPHICMVLFFTHIPFVVNHTINATPPERLQHGLSGLMLGVRGWPQGKWSCVVLPLTCHCCRINYGPLVWESEVGRRWPLVTLQKSVKRAQWNWTWFIHISLNNVGKHKYCCFRKQYIELNKRKYSFMINAKTKDFASALRLNVYTM